MAENEKMETGVEVKDATTAIKDESGSGVSEYEEVLKTGEYRLSKPYKFGDGPEQKVLKFPLKDMTGQHIRTAQSNYEVIQGRAVLGMAELNKNYLAYIAAALMDVQPDFVFDLPVMDFIRLTVYVQDFLLYSR